MLIDTLISYDVVFNKQGHPATTEPKLSDCNNNQQNELSDFPAFRAPSPVHVVLDAQQIVGHSLQRELM